MLARWKPKNCLRRPLPAPEPWFVSQVHLDIQSRRLDIAIDFRRGAVFACPECQAADCKAYDTEKRRWRHLNFFHLFGTEGKPP